MSQDKNECKITITKDGPCLVSGNVPLFEKIIVPYGNSYKYKDGDELPQSKTYSLCRCGETSTPPFCDGSHLECGFDGSEVASTDDYLDRIIIKIDGPGLDLLDDGRCALARFCHRQNGDSWDLTETSDNPKDREEAIKGAEECPAGRITAYSKDGHVFEPEYEPSIDILQDLEYKVSGPMAIKGNIPIVSSNGYTYEIRNRVALCRCGKSKNKPFCDSIHLEIKYLDKK